MLKRSLPFINVSRIFFDPDQKTALQHELMQKALSNAKAKLSSLTQDGHKYEIVGIQELDSKLPYGPEHYDYNRVVVERVRVKARLL
ncbi:hypothetical protein ACFSKU_03020 [Pontibacter silvestris]|uniref:Uncharacterized protein n=1 Tax=Pontibacter silvestris TaxID=2305183 RepID=A0ABW4WV46_9BACT|nr:hypothetical protein [Pontibacter silvestris]MCC9138613.1 hypothetical protein [Pontibacter silvestris]